MKKYLTGFLTILVYIFMAAPILVLIVFSFNESKSLSVFSACSFRWYIELLNDRNTMEAVRNSLILASVATIIATIMGTAAAWGINRINLKWYRKTVDMVIEIPMINPDIITGISFMLMFVFIGRFISGFTGLNFWTMLIAHVTFCLPYIILQVLPKLEQMDSSVWEAAMDLGCTTFRAFFKVELPELIPGIVTGAIMAFTMSLDDFVISYFTSGTGFETLPVRIYGMTKKTVTPKMYALATIIFFITLFLLIIINMINGTDTKTRYKIKYRKENPKTE